MKQDKIDILIIGSGMAGLSLAALLAQQDFAVTVIDREHPETMAKESFDVRTVALSVGSRDILMPLGIWDELLLHSAPIQSIDVQEGHDPFLLNFNAEDTEAPPSSSSVSDRANIKAFGWIFPNNIVRGKLYEVAKKHGVNFIAPAILKDIRQEKDHVTAILQDGREVVASVLIGADGRQSRVRDLIGVPTINLPYHHVAWVGMVHHEHPHNGLAVERFYTDGPFAVLPFTDTTDGKHRSAIVWSQHAKGSAKRSLPPLNEITESLKPLFDDRYGEIEAFGKWAAFPLSLTHAKSMIASRVALISDAAHAIHPIAGQGLNLGMRDVDVLVDELLRARMEGEDLGSKYVLETYQQRRRFDVFAMIAATDALTRLFGNRLKSVAKLRSLGLGVVDKLPPLKRFFANTAMGK